MKIANSQVQMASQRAYVETHAERESLRVWKDGEGSMTLTRESGRVGLQAQAEQLSRRLDNDRLELSPKAKKVKGMKKGEVPKDAEMGPMDDLKVSLIKKMVEMLTGKELHLMDPKDLEVKETGQDDELAELGQARQGGEGQPADREGWGVVYEYSSEHYEAEAVTFSASGTVRTEDGREIQFTADLNMSREFMSREQISLRAGDALKDPLVINFSGSAAELTETKFSFDIDADGREDQISFVNPGSGFLALDKNGDGQVNDGSELFGTKSGDGFGDLAKYDSDGNSWIDENDSIYVDLRIWSKDAQGNDQLIGLGQAGVGAIYLGHVGTQFDARDDQNQLQGQVRSTGIYLHENGQVGTVQQVDLAVGEERKEPLDLIA